MVAACDSRRYTYIAAETFVRRRKHPLAAIGRTLRGASRGIHRVYTYAMLLFFGTLGDLPAVSIYSCLIERAKATIRQVLAIR